MRILLFSSTVNGFYSIDGIGWADGDRFDEDSSFNSLTFSAKWSIASETSYTVDGKDYNKRSLAVVSCRAPKANAPLPPP